MRVFWILVATCLAATVLVRPLAPVFSRGYAVWNACPLTTEDLQTVLPRDSRSGTDVLVSPRTDPWGRPFHVSRSPWRTFVFSVGPDGRDEGGQGDDVAVLPIDTYVFVAWAPAYFGGATIALLWSWLVLRLLRAPRSESLETELVRAFGIATLPTAACTALVLATVKDLSLFTPVPIQGFSVPPGVAVALCFGLVFSVVGLRLRHRASLPLEEAAPPRAARRPRLQVLVPTLGVVALVPLAGRVVDARRTAWNADRLLVSAQLGLVHSIQELVHGDDLDRLRLLVKHRPPGFPDLVRTDADLRSIARIGPDAVPFLIEAVAERARWQSDLEGVAWEQLVAFDPQLEQLSREAVANPTRFERILLNRTGLIAGRLGRRRVLEALAPWLANRRLTYTGGRFCDRTARVFADLVGNSHEVAVPDSETSGEWHRAVARIEAWWRLEHGTTLPPAGWIVVNARNAPQLGIPGLSIDLDSVSVRRIVSSRQETVQSMGPLSPGPHTITISTGATKLDVPVVVPPDGEAWIDVDFATGKTTVTTAQEK